jgi:SAM-dependent methyltransferase
MVATFTAAMTLELLVCPGCRTLRDGRLDVRTLERDGDVLRCACGRRYPILDGVPLVLADPAAFLRGEIAAVVERDLDPEVAALLVEHGPDDAPYARLLEHLSIYLDAHWGDRAEPPPDGPGASFALAPLVERVAARPAVGHAVELGCSTGRITAELAAEHVVGLDLQLAAVRRARRLLDGERVTFARRVIGRTYSAAAITAGDRTRSGAGRLLLCADALDPPLLPASFDRVVALNLLDSVHSPRQLLAVIDGLCASGGEVLLASPYAWQSGVVHEHERFGGADPAAALVALLSGGTGLTGRYQIEEEAELSWTLRRDARSSVTYRTHYLRARKGT